MHVPVYAQMIAIDFMGERIATMGERYETALAAMGTEARARTEEAQGNALAYYWGRLDAGDTPRFDDYEFGLAYALHAAAFYSGQASSRSPYREAYRQFDATGQIDPIGF